MPQTPHVESDVDPGNTPLRFRRVKIRCIPSLQLAKEDDDNHTEQDPGDRKAVDDSTATRGTGALRPVHQARAFREASGSNKT
jgi:hypothetical protein